MTERNTFPQDMSDRDSEARQRLHELTGGVLDEVKDLGDRDMKKTGLSDSLDARLTIDGGDGIYGNMATLLKTSVEDGKETVDFAAIKRFANGDLRTMIDHSVEGEKPESYLVILSSDGTIEGFPTDKQRPFSKASWIKNLDADKAEAIVIRVVETFEDERDKRNALREEADSSAAS